MRVTFAHHAQHYGTRRLRAEVQAEVRAAPNRLLDQPAPTASNRVWTSVITYLPRQGGGWLYLAVWLDRCSRKVVGWDVRETMPADLVSEALRRAGRASAALSFSSVS